MWEDEPRLKRLLKKLGVQAVYDASCVAAGWLSFRRTGVTPRRAQGGLVSLFCRTGGRSNDLLHRLAARHRPPLALTETRGVLGEMNEPQLQAIRTQLEQHGYHVFEQRLPADLCDRLLQFALTEPATVRAGGASENRVYERHAPRGARYDFEEPALLREPAVQQLMADPSILAVAQAYLGCAPILDFVSMWWHTSWSDAPDAGAGQLFHFDMDRIKWLKFFIYLTDVGPENGPHTFVAGSHRTSGIPRAILEKGQTRIEDDDVRRAYPADALVEFCAPRGTVIAEDTRGLHKGKHVRSGDRLVLQLELTDSLFGVHYPEPQAFAAGPQLQKMARAYPGVYSRFVR